MSNLGFLDRYLLKSLDRYVARPTVTDEIMQSMDHLWKLVRADKSSRETRVAVLENYYSRLIRHEFGNVTIFCGGFHAAQKGIIDDLDPLTNGKFPRLSLMHGVRNTPNAWYAGALSSKY